MLAGLVLGAVGAPAAAQDPLDAALLAATPAPLPAGTSAATVESGRADADDRNSGVLGNSQIAIAADDPRARINGLVLPIMVMAADSSSRFGTVVAEAGASHRFVPYPPHATCAETAKGAVCAQAIERVAVFSLASCVERTAALLQAAIDHPVAVARSKRLR